MISADFSAARWTKSSHSGNSTDCVEVAFAPSTWTKSSYSGNTTDCVEVASTGRAVGVRDSKRPAAGRLVFSDRAWRSFLDRAFSA